MSDLNSIQDQYYEGQPTVNWKCIIFTVLLSLGYWFLPYRNKWVLLALLYFPYLALAWYDYMYVCERNMGPTYLSTFYWWAKPQESKQIKQYKAWRPDIKRKVLIVDGIIILVVLALTPLFLKWKPKKV